MQIDLWSFANRVYAAPNIEQLCLTAQNQGANVCLILCALWLESTQKAFNPEVAVQLQKCARTDESRVIAPLRALRMQWKPHCSQDADLNQLREAVKMLELTAEKTLLGKCSELCANLPCGNAKGQWLKILSQPVIWQDQELHLWEQLLTGVKPLF